jgi:hypothetical protein
MTLPDPPPTDDYVLLTEMAARLNVGVDKARAATRIAGFPRKDPIYGKWSWAAVVAFNRRREGLTVDAPKDRFGHEDLHAKPPSRDRRRPGPSVATPG